PPPVSCLSSHFQVNSEMSSQYGLYHLFYLSFIDLLHLFNGIQHCHFSQNAGHFPHFPHGWAAAKKIYVSSYRTHLPESSEDQSYAGTVHEIDSRKIENDILNYC